jgi:hypothetical protein
MFAQYYNHGILIIGLPSSLLEVEWLVHFSTVAPWKNLSGRTQITKFGNEVSDRVEVNGGVPQGSRLGPVAFIVHINGFPSALAKRERTFDNEVSEGDDDDVTIFMVTQQSLKL